MAKHSVKETPGRVKFRVIEFELDGSDVALQDAIKGLTTALADRSRGGQVRRITSGNGAAPPALDEPIDTEAQEDQGEQPEAAAEPRASRPRAKQVARPPKIVETLEFTSGDVPLKTFIEQKKPEGANKRYLSIAYWLKHYRKIESVNADHIYTAFRFLGWNVSGRPDKPLSNMKGQGWFVGGAQPGEFTINHIGEGVVNDMNGK